MSYNLMLTKRAIRQYSSKEVPLETMNKVANAGRIAQSSKNEQGWKFIVVREKETLKKLSECGMYTKHLANAAFGIVLVQTHGWLFDLGQAAAYMQLAAWEEGVGSCLLYMHEEERAKQLLEVPKEHTLNIIIAFGYPKDPSTGKKKTIRQEFDEVVKYEKFS